MTRRRGWRSTGRAVAALAALAGVALLAGCSTRFGLPEPASEQGETVLGLWRGVFWAAIAVGGVVWALIIWSILRYRRRDDELPPQHAHNVRIEIVYSVVPVLIVAVIFAFTVATERDVSGLTDDPDEVVEVLGFQWQWRFTYPEHDVTVVGTPGQLPELVLPVDRTTRFDLETADVIHAFWVPNFLTKRDLIPRVDNEIDITPTELGEYRGKCAEFCGLDHYRMNFTVRVVTAEEFESWLAEQREGPT